MSLADSECLSVEAFWAFGVHNSFRCEVVEVSGEGGNVMQQHSAAAIANEFLNLAWSDQDSSLPIMDQMKLQKLVFYAHAWWLAHTDKPLIEEEFEAWPWGPVVRSVWTETKDFGRLPINRRIRSLQLDVNNPVNAVFVYPSVEDPAVKDFLKEVWEIHKRFSGIQLSNSTHAPGEPWTLVANSVNGNLDSKPSIPNELIQSVFKNKIH
ncbi:Panacea domain-containing protein [Komagataeibacter rhaeticus]|uniref:Panacea domain-containing protein n=1 Tax=Komagataeibacter rhaeticus TaxID=215221 RepID=UPI0039EBE7F1